MQATRWMCTPARPLAALPFLLFVSRRRTREENQRRTGRSARPPSWRLRHPNATAQSDRAGPVSDLLNAVRPPAMVVLRDPRRVRLDPRFPNRHRLIHRLRVGPFAGRRPARSGQSDRQSHSQSAGPQLLGSHRFVLLFVHASDFVGETSHQPRTENEAPLQIFPRTFRKSGHESEQARDRE